MNKQNFIGQPINLKMKQMKNLICTYQQCRFELSISLAASSFTSLPFLFFYKPTSDLAAATAATL